MREEEGKEENPGNKMVKVFQRNKSPFNNKALKLWIFVNTT